MSRTREGEGERDKETTAGAAADSGVCAGCAAGRAAWLYPHFRAAEAGAGHPALPVNA